jgi:hypothetical protein
MKYIAGSYRPLEGRVEWHVQDSIFADSSGVTLSFRFGREPENLARRLLASYLVQGNESWLRPVSSPEGPWLIDLEQLKNRFPVFLQSLDWLKGRLKINPIYLPQERIDDEQNIDKLADVEFIILMNDLKPFIGAVDFPELIPSLDRFRMDHPDPNLCAFLMMKFEETRLHGEIVKAINAVCQNSGIVVLRADEKRYANQLWLNVQTYMHGCNFGIAVLERLTANEFNPNVSLEVGYMMAQGKPVCLLKDSTLTSLQTDLMGHLYDEFDPQNAEVSIPVALERWLRDIKAA